MRGVVERAWNSPPGPELARLSADLDPCRAAVDEVQLVLLVVVVVEPLVARREDDRVHAEGLDAQRLPHLAEAVALAELVERSERVLVSHGATLSRVRPALHGGLTVGQLPLKAFQTAVKPASVEEAHEWTHDASRRWRRSPSRALSELASPSPARACSVTSSGSDTVTVRDVTVEGIDAGPDDVSHGQGADDRPDLQAHSTRCRPDHRDEHRLHDEQRPFSGNPFGAPQQEQQRALGSGFVIDKSGYIITNYHVVEGAKSIQVTFSNNASIKASLVGSDPSTDIAVLKVNTPSSALTPLTLGNSDLVQVGDSVVAIGNPFGLSRTVTAGIVSAIQREIQAPNDYEIDHVIQTDAPINHGNSGGPLINARGEVIGVNAQIETGGTTDGNVGVGFSIPSNTVKTVAAQLIKTGKVEHAAIGILAQDLTPDLAEDVPAPGQERRPRRDGPARQRRCEGRDQGRKENVTVAGESYKLGGDIIVAADGAPVHDLAGLRDVGRDEEAGRHDHAHGLPRHAQKLTVKVKLGRRPSSPSG